MFAKALLKFSSNNFGYFSKNFALSSDTLPLVKAFLYKLLFSLREPNLVLCDIRDVFPLNIGIPISFVASTIDLSASVCGNQAFEALPSLNLLKLVSKPSSTILFKSFAALLSPIVASNLPSSSNISTVNTNLGRGPNSVITSSTAADLRVYSWAFLRIASLSLGFTINIFVPSAALIFI